MESHSLWFKGLADQLTARGWAVQAPNLPGWGEREGPAGDLASYRDLLDNLSQRISLARERFSSVHLVGMSWGGLASLYFGLRRGWQLDSLALLAPGLTPRRGEKATTLLGFALGSFSSSPGRPLPIRLPATYFSDSPDCQRYIENDPLRQGRVTVSFARETLKMRLFIGEKAGRRRLPPALCLLGEKDRMLDNSRVAELCQRAGIRVETLAGVGHALVLEEAGRVGEALSRHASSGRAENKGRRIWVVGGGAVGSAVATLLALGGHDLGLCVKPEQARAINASGLTLLSSQGGRNVKVRAAAAGALENLPPDPDLLILAVKSYDSSAACQGLLAALSPRTTLLSLQNGVGNEQILARFFPGNPLAAGCIAASLELLTPGEVRWVDERGGVAAAPCQGDPEATGALLAGILPDSGMEYLWQPAGGEAGDDALTPGARRLKWSKLMLNLAFNALNSLTGLASPELLADSVYSRLALASLREGFQVMRGLGLEPLDLPGYPVARLSRLVRLPGFLARPILAWQARLSPVTHSSMRQDFIRRRPTSEIEALNALVVRQGEALGLPVSANREICRRVAGLTL
jgi:2-dehydropantoate 2-reductase